jgi:hypothetical protein
VWRRELTRACVKVGRIIRKSQAERALEKSKAAFEKRSERPCRTDSTTSTRSSSTALSEQSAPCSKRETLQTPRHDSCGPHHVVEIGRSHTSSTQSVNQRSNSRALKGLNRREQSVRCEPENLQSSVFPFSQEWLRRGSARAAIPEQSEPRKKAISASATRINKDLEPEEKSQGSVFSEGPSSPFTQPGMTAQTSANLVFGVGARATVQSHLQGGCMNNSPASHVRHHASRQGQESSMTTHGRQLRSKPSRPGM